MHRLLNAWLAFPLAESWTRRSIRPKLHLLRQDMVLPFAERKRRRLARLAEVIDRASHEVPYYRDLVRTSRFDAGRVARDERYLADLPYLTKDILREQGKRMLSQRYDGQHLELRKTGGSTGPTTAIYYDRVALDWSAAVNLLVREWAGKPPGAKEVHLASRFPEVFPWRDRAKERCKCLAMNRANIFIDTFEPAGLDAIWRSLARHKPYLLQGHPSTMYALAVHLRNRQIDAKGRLQVFESTGEVLDARKRELIETVFGCRVVDRFGNAECGVVAYEPLAPHRQPLRVVDAVVWPENLAHEGGTPEIVLSGLLNRAMPLLRYRTGDLGLLSQDEGGFVLDRIMGRVHDVVQIGPDRFPTHYIQDLVDRLDGVEEFQLEQRRGGALRLRLVVPNTESHSAISRRVETWWGKRVELEFTDFAGLERRGWQHKFRYLVDSAAA